jgi:CheY-like chemotaxis protein
MESKKILVVDDYRDSRKMVIKLLQSSDIDAEYYEAIHAENAFEILATEKIDLIISDLMMPGLNGCEFIDKVRKEKAIDTKFILITASLDNFQKIGSNFDQEGVPLIETSQLFTKLVIEVKNSLK